ncbi:MAG: hypothetical protein K5770_05955 [Lachnospiraceae bacterium]|nr:hypothetical protein [Lachnospiraceae bacterium]
MKAVVLDITDGEATVMTKSGDIIGVRDESYEIGQEIMVKRNLGSNIIRFLPAVAAAAVLLLTAGTGSYAYLKPYGTVSLDVNPSIEYSINRFDRVLNISGVNDDGSDIVASLDVKQLKYRDIETAIDNTIDQIDAAGYFMDEENYVVVTANTKAEVHTEELVDKLDKAVSRHDKVKPISSKVSDDELKKAHEQGISAGKKMMVDRLDDISDEEIDRSKWNEKSVKDIADEYDRIREKKEKPYQPDQEGRSVEIVTDEPEMNNPEKSNPDNGSEGKAPEEKTEYNNKPSDNGMQGGDSKPVDNNEPPSEEKNERGNDVQAPPTDNGNPSLPPDDNGSHGSDEAPTPPDNNADFGGGHPGDGNDPGQHGGMEEPGHSDHGDMPVPQDGGNAQGGGNPAPPNGNGGFGGDNR